MKYDNFVCILLVIFWQLHKLCKRFIKVVYKSEAFIIRKCKSFIIITKYKLNSFLELLEIESKYK